MVAGFQVPENVRYHAGHTWALSESRELVRIGMDDFASKLIGKIESIALPQRGRWVRQGQKIWTIFRDGKSVDMVSPIEGTVTDINEAVVKNPELARKDPYGEGWLVTVQAPDSKTQLPQPAGRNAGPLVDRIRRPAASQANAGAWPARWLRMAASRSTIITAHMPDEDWAAHHERILPFVELADEVHPTSTETPPGTNPGRFSISRLVLLSELGAQ